MAETNQIPRNLKHNSKYTPELGELIAEMVGSGTPVAHAAQACGIDRTTFYAWLESDPSLATEIKKRRSQAVHERVEVIRQAMPKQWTAAAWYLERQHPEEFGLKQNQPDISITVQVRDCTQDTRVQVVACEQTPKQIVGTMVHNQGLDI